MTTAYNSSRRLKQFWLSAWPLWTLTIFAGIAVLRLMPGGYGRAALAAPIVLMVPGALTLGAIFSPRRRPQGAVFISCAALLSVVWSGFASLSLYLGHLLITAASTYWSLLIISSVLAIGAQARLLLGRGSGRRVVRKPNDRDLSDVDADDAETSTASTGGGYYATAAVLAGIGLLVGALYAYDHLPRPAAIGYTWMAWTGPPIKGNIAVGSAGTKLGFEIVHHQSDTTTFRVTAAWLGTSSQPLARPMTLSIGPDKTFRAALFVPPLANGCTYRIVVALTATRQIDPQTKRLRTWSINADVYNPGKSLQACK